MKLEELREQMKPYVRDEKILDLPDYNLAIDSALSQYSQIRPRQLSQTAVVRSTFDVLTSSIADFDEGFFDMIEIEYPIAGPGKPVYLWKRYYTLYETSGGQVVRFFTVPGGETVRFQHYAPHVRPVDDETAITVRGSDLAAVIKWAASEALTMLANRYSGQSTESSVLTADIAGFVSKGRDCEERAKTLRGLVYDHFASGSRRLSSVARVYRG